MPLSTYAADNVLSHLLGIAAWTMPTNTYFSLHTADPGLTGVSEVSAGWYSRVVASWNSATTSGATNNGQHTFSAVTGSGVTVTHIGIWDASSGGNFLFSIDVADTLFDVGAVPKIPDQAVTITPGAAYSNYVIPRITDHLTGVAAFTFDVNVWTGLNIGDPTATGTGGVEFTGGAYGRVNIGFDTPSGGVTDNTVDEPYVTATANLGTASHLIIRDTPTGGQLILFGPLTSSVTVNDGDDYQFSEGDLDFAI